MSSKNTVSKSKPPALQPKNAISKSNLVQQFKALLPTFLKIYIPLLCIFLIIRLQNRIPVGNLTKDPLALTGDPFYFGILSQVGVLFWCSCAAICFFCGILLAKIKPRKLSSFYFTSGAITSMLLIDDLFLMHEVVFPKYLNIPEKVVLSVYGILILLYLLKFKQIIQNTEFIPLILAFTFFGFSVIADSSLIYFPQSWLKNEGQYLLEDGAKLIGIISWYIYFIRACMTQIKQAIWYQQVDIN